MTNHNLANVTALRSLLSPDTQEDIDELTKRFTRFKQQFDRGIAVQSGATLETLLDDMGTFSYLFVKEKL